MAVSGAAAATGHAWTVALVGGPALSALPKGGKGNDPANEVELTG